jgi:hypothetical protein
MGALLFGLVAGFGLTWVFMELRRDGYWREFNARRRGSNLPAQMHCTNRTSPLGEDYIGACYLCGKTGIGDAEMFEECENPNGLTQGEALIEALENPATTLLLQQAQPAHAIPLPQAGEVEA